MELFRQKLTSLSLEELKEFVADCRSINWNWARMKTQTILRRVMEPCDFVIRPDFHPKTELLKLWLVSYRTNIAKLDSPSEEICLAAVEANPLAFILMPGRHRTPKVAMAAVARKGGLLKYVKQQTPEICLTAVKNRGWALEYVKDQTPEICMAAVKNGGWALKYVKQQTPEICMAAVEQCGLVLNYVKHADEAICLAATSQDHRALQIVWNRWPHLGLSVQEKIERREEE